MQALQKYYKVYNKFQLFVHFHKMNKRQHKTNTLIWMKNIETLRKTKSYASKVWCDDEHFHFLSSSSTPCFLNCYIQRWRWRKMKRREKSKTKNFFVSLTNYLILRVQKVISFPREYKLRGVNEGRRKKK